MIYHARCVYATVRDIRSPGRVKGLDTTGRESQREIPISGRCRSKRAVSATLTFAVALAMRGTGACLAGFYFVVPRQQKKTEKSPSPLEVAESVAVSWLVRTTTAPRKKQPRTGQAPNPVKAPVEAAWPQNNRKNATVRRNADLRQCCGPSACEALPICPPRRQRAS